MSEYCPNAAIRNQKVRIITTEGDIYFDENPDEARKIFEKLKKEKKSVDGASSEISHILNIDGKIVDVF